MTSFITRLKVGDYDSWKPNFDSDGPGARRAAIGHRIFRSLDDPGEVFMLVEFASADAARAGRQPPPGLRRSGRFPDKVGPTVVEEAESVTY